MRTAIRHANAVIALIASGFALSCGSGAQPVTLDSAASSASSAPAAPSELSASSATLSSSPPAASSSPFTTLSECAITAPTQWVAGVYVVNCNVEVVGSLTIDPGAIVKFGPGFYLSVLPQGKLSAVGTELQPIVFTSQKDDAHGGDTNGDGPSAGARGDWGCQGACGVLNLQGEGAVLEYVEALYGSNGVYVQAGTAQIRNSTFAHHNTYGLVLDGGFPVETTQLNGNRLFDNDGYPLHLGKPVFLNSSNIFHDPADPATVNAKQCIELDTDLDQLAVLGVTELAFLFSGRRVTAGILTPPGVIFKSQDAAIYLDAAGSFTNGPNVLFTSYRDDALGGDCTGDGAGVPAVGDWEGLRIDDGSTVDYAAPIDYIRYPANSGTMVLH